MASEKRAGVMDEIRCDEKDYLIWKWCPTGDSRRENALRWGSSLRVRDGSVAVFVYRRKGEQAVQEFIEGPYDETLKTSNLPVIASLVSAAYGGGTPFQAEVYFINLARIVQLRFAVRYFDVFDARFPDFGVPVAVRGNISFRIADYRGFIALHRLDEFDLDDFSNQMRDLVSRKVKSIVAALPLERQMSVWQLAGMTDEVSERAYNALSPTFREVHGIEVSAIDVSAIDVDKEGDGYRRLAELTTGMAAATVRAQTEANIRTIRDTQRIQMENLSEQLRIEREEGQYAVHKNTQTQNFPAYQVEASTTVGVAGAEALGHLGENGAASVGLGGGGTDMAGLAAGVALGGAVGRSLADAWNSVSPRASHGTAVPPPVPQSAFYVAVDGKAAGPFELASLSAMASTGTLRSSSLVWKEGMGAWRAASDVPELKAIVSGGSTPPPVPSS